MDLLKGVRVLDATSVLAGPLCTYLLALSGAEVIKVEGPPSGDFSRNSGPDPALNEQLMGASFLPQNGGKRSIFIDLKTAAGKALFRQLARKADVVVENFRPGVMRRLGLDYERLKEVNPRLIYCAISGFGQEGPLADRPAYDHVIQGLAGGMMISGDAETGPVKAGFQFCDTTAAMMGAYAIAAALLRRHSTGVGAFLDVSMLDTALFTIGWPLAHFLSTGEAPRAMGNHNFTGCPSGTFRTADGLLNLVTNTDAQFAALCRILGKLEWLSDPRFAMRDERLRNRDAMTQVLEAELAARSAAEWEELFASADVPAAKVLSIPEILAHPQIAARGFIHRFGAVPGVDRDIAVPTAGFQVDGQPLAPNGPPQQLGQDTDRILTEMGLSHEEIEALRQDGVLYGPRHGARRPSPLRPNSGSLAGRARKGAA